MNINDYIFVNRKVLELVGLYPINILRYVLCVGCLLLIIIPKVVQICENWRDLSIVVETSSDLFTIVLALLKSLVLIYNRRNLQSFIDFMVTNYWQLAINTDTSEHLRIYATYAKKMTKGYLFLMCNALLFYYSLPVIETLVSTVTGTTDNSTKNFPFTASYPTAYYDFPFYEIIYVSQIVATSVCALLMLSTDTLIATALFHTCGHFKLLQENVKQLNADLAVIEKAEYGSEDASLHLQKIKARIAKIVRHHQIVLWFCDNMETNFNPLLLLQTLASSLIICLVGVQISTTLTEHSKVLKYFSYLMVALSQLLLFCFPGDLLIYQSTGISEAVYSIHWHKLIVPLKTEMCMLISRGQKPCYITAGKLYVMHLENFSAVLSTALSYFMMLRSLRSETTGL